MNTRIANQNIRENNSIDRVSTCHPAYVELTLIETVRFCLEWSTKVHRAQKTGFQVTERKSGVFRQALSKAFDQIGRDLEERNTTPLETERRDANVSAERKTCRSSLSLIAMRLYV
jgi:hypothetical protein